MEWVHVDYLRYISLQRSVQVVNKLEMFYNVDSQLCNNSKYFCVCVFWHCTKYAATSCRFTTLIEVNFMCLWLRFVLDVFAA